MASGVKKSLWEANFELGSPSARSVLLVVERIFFIEINGTSALKMTFFPALKEQPQRVCQDHEGNISFTTGSSSRAGHEADVKRDVHWLWLFCREFG